VGQDIDSIISGRSTKTCTIHTSRAGSPHDFVGLLAVGVEYLADRHDYHVEAVEQCPDAEGEAWHATRPLHPDQAMERPQKSTRHFAKPERNPLEVNVVIAPLGTSRDRSTRGSLLPRRPQDVDCPVAVEREQVTAVGTEGDLSDRAGGPMQRGRSSNGRPRRNFTSHDFTTLLASPPNMASVSPSGPKAKYGPPCSVRGALPRWPRPTASFAHRPGRR
jgi:hypothetical protein